MRIDIDDRKTPEQLKSLASELIMCPRKYLIEKHVFSTRFGLYLHVFFDTRYKQSKHQVVMLDNGEYMLINAELGYNYAALEAEKYFSNK